MKNPSLVDYVINRLADLGIEHVFGVRGDGAFHIEDAVERSDRVTWVGSSNDLNAAYAADGYARIRGAAILSTTSVAGEASALNEFLGSKGLDRKITRATSRFGSSPPRSLRCQGTPLRG
jgi:indolepyruvate decarboxylase